jgi:3-deoxy-D-manno-octulosonate 8-phosphate phosphatase (KDO 8-P phosphatase)
MKQVPVVAIVSGEKNNAAFKFAAREHFDAVYYKMSDKTQAFEHLCNKYSLDASEIVWVFDDVPDLSFARKAGLRIMISRAADPLLPLFVKQLIWLTILLSSMEGVAAVRELSDLLIGLAGLQTTQ